MILVDSVINDTENALFFIQNLKTSASQDSVFNSNQSGNQMIFNLKLYIKSNMISQRVYHILKIRRILIL